MMPNEVTLEKLAEIFRKSIENNKDFQEALEIARRNSAGGKIWVMGGQVYRSIIAKLNHLQFNQEYDFDFIVEKPVARNEFFVPVGWKLTSTGLGQPRLIKGKKQIDIASIDRMVDDRDKAHITNMNVNEKIDSYFRRAPLNVQGLVYDIDNDILLGEGALKSIRERSLMINNIEECLTFCRRRKRSLYDFLTTRAQELNFTFTKPQLTDDSQTETTEFYNKYSEQYAAERGQAENSFMQSHLKSLVEKFFTNLPGKKVVDLGSGSGRDGLILKQHGLEPLCIDASPEMIKLCKAVGLNAQVGDMEWLNLENSSFNGVWAFASLIHVPKKRMFNVLARIHEILKPNGMFFVVMVGGQGETLHRSKNKPDKQRFFNLYANDEFAKEIIEYFDIIDDTEFSENGEKYLGFVCKRRELPAYSTL